MVEVHPFDQLYSLPRYSFIPAGRKTLVSPSHIPFSCIRHPSMSGCDADLLHSFLSEALEISLFIDYHMCGMGIKRSLLPEMRDWFYPNQFVSPFHDEKPI
jgi:hypothetical protein